MGEAQDHDYIQYTTKDGLPTNYVYGVIEDDEGYIWAYTENGMSKFDGYTFKNFSTKDGLPGNDVVFCYKDKDGKLWLYTYFNLPAYIQGDSIQVVYDHPGIPIGLDQGHIIYSCFDSQIFTYRGDQIEFFDRPVLDSTILADNPGFFILDSVDYLPANNSQQSFKNTGYGYSLFQNDSVFYYSLKEEQFIKQVAFLDGYSFYFPATGWVYLRKGNQKKTFRVEPFKKADQNYSSLFHLIADTKILYSLGNQYFFLLDTETEKGRFLDFRDINNSDITFNMTLLNHSFLISSEFGYWEYDFEGHLVDQLIMKDLGSNYFLRRSFKDSKGNVWIGSREGGLFFIPNKKRKTKLVHASASKDKVFEQLITTNDNQLLGITDNSGVYLIQKDTMISLLPPDNNYRFRSAVNTPYGIIMSSSEKTSLIINEGNQFTFHNPYTFFSLASNSKKPVANSLWNKRSMSYHEEESALYATSTRALLEIIQFTADKMIEIDYSPVRRFSNLHYHPLHQKIYAGSLKGIDYYESDNPFPILRQFEQLKNISALFSTGDNLWIGTESNGLYFYDFNTTQLTQISTANMIRKIRPATDSTLLIACNKGVLHIHKNNLEKPLVNQFTINDGLRTNEIQDTYFDGNHFIYVATSEGLHRLDMNAHYESTASAAALRVTSLRSNKVEVNQSKPLEWSHRENTIDIGYQLLSYASNGKVKYGTRLEPLEKDWQHSATPHVNYLSLPPDDYTFHLKATDIYGNDVSLDPIRFSIKKAWWQTIWFKALAALLTLALFIGIVRYRDNLKRQQINKEKEVNRRMAALELSALKAQMNPHFVFNALGAIQYFIQTNEVEAADSYLTRFARLMRKYLDSSKEKMTSLKDEIELLSIYTDLEEMRFEDLFSSKVEVDSDIQTEDTFLPSMIIQPFVENAINHGLPMRKDKKGLLKVQFSKSGNTLLCNISDNGIGRKQAQKIKWKGHQSRGMAIVTEKLNTLRSSGLADVTIDIKDLNPKDKTYPGTQVILKIKNLEDEQL